MKKKLEVYRLKTGRHRKAIHISLLAAAITALFGFDVIAMSSPGAGNCKCTYLVYLDISGSMYRSDHKLVMDGETVDYLDASLRYMHYTLGFEGLPAISWKGQEPSGDKIAGLSRDVYTYVFYYRSYLYKKHSLNDDGEMGPWRKARDPKEGVCLFSDGRKVRDTLKDLQEITDKESNKKTNYSSLLRQISADVDGLLRQGEGFCHVLIFSDGIDDANNKEELRKEIDTVKEKLSGSWSGRATLTFFHFPKKKDIDPEKEYEVWRFFSSPLRDQPMVIEGNPISMIEVARIIQGLDNSLYQESKIRDNLLINNRDGEIITDQDGKRYWRASFEVIPPNCIYRIDQIVYSLNSPLGDGGNNTKSPAPIKGIARVATERNEDTISVKVAVPEEDLAEAGPGKNRIYLHIVSNGNKFDPGDTCRVSFNYYKPDPRQPMRQAKTDILYLTLAFLVVAIFSVTAIYIYAKQ